MKRFYDKDLEERIDNALDYHKPKSIKQIAEDTKGNTASVYRTIQKGIASSKYLIHSYNTTNPKKVFRLITKSPGGLHVSAFGKSGIIPNAQLTPPAQPKEEGYPTLIQKMAQTIEMMAEAIKEKDDLIASLQARLKTENNLRISEKVRRAMAVYGD